MAKAMKWERTRKPGAVFTEKDAADDLPWPICRVCRRVMEPWRQGWRCERCRRWFRSAL